MEVRNARNWAPRDRRRWLLAAAALIVAAGVRLALHPLLGSVMPGTAFCIAASLVEYYLGLAPALTVMLLGLGIADYLFVPPYADFSTINRNDVLLIVSYPLVTLLVIALIEHLRRAQFRAQLIASVAQSRYEMLLRQDNERALAKRAIDETHRLLRHLAQHHHRVVLIKALERNAMQRASVGQRLNATELATPVAPGPLFDDVHSEDIQRLSNALWPGSHRVRLLAAGHASDEMRLTQCTCERFTTHAGDFLVLRTEN